MLRARIYADVPTETTSGVMLNVGAARPDYQHIRAFRGWCEPLCFFFIETSPYDVFLLAMQWNDVGSFIHKWLPDLLNTTIDAVDQAKFKIPLTSLQKFQWVEKGEMSID